MVMFFPEALSVQTLSLAEAHLWMRAELVARIGGYDASLRARSAEGCEDWKLYLQLAEDHLSWSEII